MMQVMNVFMNMDKRIGADFEKGLAQALVAGGRVTLDAPNRMDVTIAPLWGHRELAPVLARWHHDEFGYLYDERIWNHDIATLELEAMSEPGSRDITWIAFEGTTADEDSLLGSVSLISSDDLPGFDQLSPWLASLYITPRARSRGLGGRSSSCVVSEAADRATTTSTSSPPGRTPITSPVAGGRSPRSIIAVTARS